MEAKEFQRWTARRKVELLLQLIRGERKLVDVCREHDLKQSEGWASPCWNSTPEKYHTERPHSALGYLTPKEFAERLAA